MRYYKVGVGVGGVPLEFHIVGGRNLLEVRSFAIRNYCDPSKGFDHVEVKLIRREPVRACVNEVNAIASRCHAEGEKKYG